ncbi:hypothetical protein [Mesobacillus subterraneus]|uniref:DUF4179 domain-containing protein n=1 Tax=Mesobacillus subterraneus TaxID=285983 RepID=A0A3R9FFZ3_9BACI|nr:hypothetical protein [Mesobacillus subterraneus]RSD25511.1 hypothetical protein EJA10_17040 [Mesobacillus subterraneus]
MSNNIRQEINKIEIPAELSTRSKKGIERAKAEMPSRSEKKWYFLAVPALAAALLFAIAGPDPFGYDVITIQTSHAFDVSDSKKLVGWADDVFIGKVIKNEGTRDDDGMVETQFKVKVSHNIKGDLGGDVIVNQQGGYTGNTLVLVENDQLLKEGEQYLFITRHNTKGDWHTLVPVYGDILIENDQHKDALIAKYRDAYEQEIPFE